MVKTVSVLGSTGSIGAKALRIAKNLGIDVAGLAVFSNVARLEEQIREFRPKKVAVFDEKAAKSLKANVANLDVEVLCGMDGLCEVAAMDGTEMVLNSVSGMVGLRPTLCAIDAGKDVALANKETLVVSGALVMERSRKAGIRILPVDSEHSAIFQCLQDCEDKKSLKKLILTASGGPFFGKNIDELRAVTKQDALKHPNWSMGSKITIDSATMMNKGFEVIEAVWLFDVLADDVDVLVHRESIVHSMVEFCDNSIIAQMGVPDMGIPIQYAFTCPERVPSIVKNLDLAQVGRLSFCKTDNATFKGIDICRAALKIGGTMPAIINAANEEAVKLFLNEKISFLEITEIVQKAMDCIKAVNSNSLDDILAADAEAREFVIKNFKK